MFKSIKLLLFFLIAASPMMAQEASTAAGNSLAESTSAKPPYFISMVGESSAPDAEGFLRRWMILDPIHKDIRTNILFTDSYLRASFVDTLYFKDQFALVMPKEGKKVKVGKENLQWRSVESNGYNVQLLRYAEQQLKVKYYGVLFFVATIIDAPEDMDVRLAIGSNSGSMWWLNGQEALILSGDRRMVMDDGISQVVKLKKGANILRGAIINGPGMSNYCVRLLNAKGEPVKNIAVRTK